MRVEDYVLSCLLFVDDANLCLERRHFRIHRSYNADTIRRLGIYLRFYLSPVAGRRGCSVWRHGLVGQKEIRVGDTTTESVLDGIWQRVEKVRA